MASQGILKDGRVYVQYPNPKWPKESPKMKREYFGRGRSAEILAMKRCDDINLAVEPHKEELLFKDVASDYLASKSNMAESNYNKLFGRFESNIIRHIGDKPISAVDKMTLARYQATRLKERRFSRPDKRTGYIREIGPPSPVSVKDELISIIAVMNFAEENGYILTNQTRGFKKGSAQGEIVRPPTEEEINALVSHSAPHLIRTILISFYCGLRPGASELFNLKWNSVDFTTGEITITSAKKRGIPRRNIPLHPAFKQMLLGWHNQDQKENIKYLVHYRGNPITTSVKNAFTKAKERAGITRRMRLYDFRHKFATMLLEGGVNIKAISDMLGHTSPTVTLGVYAHVSDPVKRSAVNGLPVITGNFGNSKQSKQKKISQLKQVVNK